MAKYEKLCNYPSSSISVSLPSAFEDSARSDKVISIPGIGFVGRSSFTCRMVAYKSSLQHHSESMLNLSQRKAAFLNQLRCDQPAM